MLIATTWLLITTVWVPTFWTLAQLPWTVNEEREASALLRYVDDDIGTVFYDVSKAHCKKKPSGNTPTSSVTNLTKNTLIATSTTFGASQN